MDDFPRPIGISSQPQSVAKHLPRSSKILRHAQGEKRRSSIRSVDFSPRVVAALARLYRKGDLGFLASGTETLVAAA